MTDQRDRPARSTTIQNDGRLPVVSSVETNVSLIKGKAKTSMYMAAEFLREDKHLAAAILQNGEQAWRIYLGIIRLWDLNSDLADFKVKAHYNHPSTVYSVAFWQDGKRLI